MTTLIPKFEQTSSTVNRPINLKLQESISVLDFGATGNGSTDDSGAIQNATNAAASAGKALFFPAGTYRLLNYVTLPSNAEWFGEIGSIIYLDPNMTLGASIGGAARALYANTASNIKISTLIFNSSSTGLTKSVSIALNAVTNLKIEDCVFQNFGNSTYYAQGLIIFGSNQVWILNSKFYNNSGDGCALSSATTNYFVSDCEFSNNGDWGLALVIACNNGSVTNNLFLNNASTATGVDRCSYVSFTNNTMNTNEHGVRVTQFAVTTDKSSHITIIGNNITNVGVAGISIESTNPTYGQITIVGNSIEGSSNQGIRIYDSVEGTIVGNTIYSCAAEGILFDAQTSGVNTGAYCVANNSIRTDTYGIHQVNTGGTWIPINVIGNYVDSSSTANYSLATNAAYINFDNVNYIDASRTFNFPSGVVASSATGGGTTPPANVQGYIPLYLSGTLYKIPFYNA